jgi:hypothetical protein
LWIVCLVVFYLNIMGYFPRMGHDYSLIISWVNDYHFAWSKYDVFNVLFTPQRCGGVPVWYNPIGSNFSFIHLLSILLSDRAVIAFFVMGISALAFWGMSQLLKLFEIKSPWREFFILGWCVQGFIISHVAVGHLPMMSIGLWPLCCYLLLRNGSGRGEKIIEGILFSLVYAHDFYSSNTYLFVMFPAAFIIFLGILWINRLSVDFRSALLKLFWGSFLTVFIILPKVLAVTSFTQNVQREVSFVDVGLLSGLNYAFMIILLPAKLYYQNLTGWQYGNWEAMNYLYPGLFVIIFVYGILKFKNLARILVSLVILLVIGAFISSGIYADFISGLPLIKSFHVNPRWMPIIFLGLLGVAFAFIKKIEIPTKISYILMILSIGYPIYMLDPDYFAIQYIYRSGMNVEKNRLSYCYEPVFGYSLELLPMHKIKGPYADPRCYISRKKCNDYNLNPKFYRELEEYRLKPFDD